MTFVRKIPGLIAALLVGVASVPAPLANAATSPLVLLRFGETRPDGWMLAQMQADLDAGLAGHYPDIADTVNRRTFVLRTADQTDADGNPGWWSGEHEGYYADGLFRLAWLSGRQSFVLAAIARLEDVLAAQDADGYIGVYAPAARYGDHDPNDAELWTQSRMFQALLAWYEATGDARILAAVDKAVRGTLAAYEYRSYFERLDYVTGGGGVSHGVGFGDTFEWLYRLTGDDVYRTGYLWLYADYATSNVRDDDLTPAHLTDGERPWYSHTPHIAEALAMPAIAFAYGGPVAYGAAADDVLDKLRRFSNPGGGPVGDESVAGRSGTFELPSEYCSMTETIASLDRLAQFRDAMATGDVVERIALNAAQGARLHPAATAVSYLSPDNRLAAIATPVLGDRLLFSASHQAAACCSLNSTRLLPYYVEGMWLKAGDESGLVARLYGPSLLDTHVGTTAVHVAEQTDFPFSGRVQFTITPDAPAAFVLTLRVPQYAPDATLTAPDSMTVTRAADRVDIAGTWHSGDVVVLDLAFAVHRVHDSGGEVALAYGPLLFALPVDATATPGRLTQAQGSTSPLLFHDVEYTASAPPPDYLMPHEVDFTPVPLPDASANDPWSYPPTGLAGSLLAADGTQAAVTLRPLGSTVLRIAGFRTDELFAGGFER